MSEIVGDAPCTSCRNRGGDRTGNHLILFDNGAAYCNRCGYREKPETFTKPTTTIKGEKTKEQIEADIKWVKENSVIQGVKDRGIKAFVCKHYGVRTGLSLEDGVTPTCYYFPVPSEDDIQGYKCVTPNKEMWAKGKGKDARFMGSDVVKRNSKKLFVTEGEWDMLSLYQTLYEFMDAKYRDRINVVSLHSGAGAADKEFLRNAELLRGYKEIVLCFDMDEPGRKAIEKVLTTINKDKVKVAKYELKDANEMLLAGKTKDLYFNVLQADPPRPEKIVCGVDVEDMMKPLLPGIDSPYPGLNAKLHGFRYGDGGGELTVFCAGSGMGKTTIAREIMYKFNKEDNLTLANIFLEEQKRKTAQSYIAIDNNVPLAALRENPSIIPADSFHRSAAELVNNGRCFFFDHWGSIDSAELMDHMYYFSKVCGCNFIMLDHISLVISGNESSSEGERKDLDILMTNLAKFCEHSGTSVLAVVHLRRPANGSFNDGMQIGLNHLRGSASIEQLAHNIIAVEGNQHGNRPNDRNVRILKAREWGDLGLADVLNYDQETGRLLPKVAGGIRG